MDIDISATYYEDEKYIWCISAKDTYLYRINKEIKILEQIVPLSDNIYIKNAFSSILSYKNVFIFIPNKIDCLVVLDRKTMEKRYVELEKINESIGVSDSKFWNGIINNNNLYLFGYAYPGILRINLDNYNMENIDGWLNEQKKYFTNEDEGCFHVQYLKMNDKVYFPFMNQNALLEFDLINENIRIFRIGRQSDRFISIEWDGTCFWLIPRDGSDGKVVKWNKDNQKEEYFDCYPEKFNRHKFAFFRTERLGAKIYLFAHASNCNICIDTSTNKMTEFIHLYFDENIKAAKYQFVWQRDKKIYVLLNNEWIEWDYDNNIVKHFYFEIDVNIKNRYEEKKMKEYFMEFNKDMIGTEKNEVGLREYIKYLNK